MAIHLALMSAQNRMRAADVVLRNFSALRTPGLALAKADSLHLSLEHPVYNLGAADLLADRGIAAARLSGVRMLVQHDQAAVATVEMPSAGSSDRYALQEGPFAAGFAAAVAKAEALHDDGDTDYELRILRVPALYAELLWLSHKDGKGDELLPVAPAPAPLDAGKVYTLTEGFKLLKTLAGGRDLRTRPS